MLVDVLKNINLINNYHNRIKLLSSFLRRVGLLKIIQYWNEGRIEKTTIYKLTLIEKIKFIFTGKITIIPKLIKGESIYNCASK
jgi:hypothetical protein